jgi:hypothetical protein
MPCRTCHKLYNVVLCIVWLRPELACFFCVSQKYRSNLAVGNDLWVAISLKYIHSHVVGRRLVAADSLRSTAECRPIDLERWPANDFSGIKLHLSRCLCKRTSWVARSRKSCLRRSVIALLFVNARSQLLPTPSPPPPPPGAIKHDRSDSRYGTRHPRVRSHSCIAQTTCDVTPLYVSFCLDVARMPFVDRNCIRWRRQYSITCLWSKNFVRRMVEIKRSSNWNIKYVDEYRSRFVSGSSCDAKHDNKKLFELKKTSPCRKSTRWKSCKIFKDNQATDMDTLRYVCGSDPDVTRVWLSIFLSATMGLIENNFADIFLEI